MKLVWGVFEQGDEVHVAPVCSVNPKGTTHVLDGLECPCLPHRDADEPNVISHNAAS